MTGLGRIWARHRFQLPCKMTPPTAHRSPITEYRTLTSYLRPLIRNSGFLLPPRSPLPAVTHPRHPYHYKKKSSIFARILGSHLGQFVDICLSGS